MVLSDIPSNTRMPKRNHLQKRIHTIEILKTVPYTNRTLDTHPHTELDHIEHHKPMTMLCIYRQTDFI